MMHGVTFGNIHSYNDLGLILAPFTPSPAPIKEQYLDIQGGHGQLDLTEKFGRIFYDNRELEFEFYIKPDDDKTFDQRVSLVSNALNGKKCKITLDRDNEYYFNGRCSVNEYELDKRIGKIVVRAVCTPFKLKQELTVHAFTLSSVEKTVTVENGKMHAIPVIECTDDDTTVIFNGNTITMNAGTHRVLDIEFAEGDNELTLSGSGTITFTYQWGDL